MANFTVGGGDPGLGGGWGPPPTFKGPIGYPGGTKYPQLPTFPGLGILPGTIDETGTHVETTAPTPPSGSTQKSGNGFVDFLKGLGKAQLDKFLKDPAAFFAAMGSVFSGAAGGQADAQGLTETLKQANNNTAANVFGTQQDAVNSRNSTTANMYGTQQDATGRRNSTLADVYGTQQGAETDAGRLNLDRNKFDLDSEGARMKRALIGSLLGNMEDSKLSMPGVTTASVSGGLRPSTLGQGGHDASAEMVARALQQVRNGNSYSGGSVLAPPSLADVGAPPALAADVAPPELSPVGQLGGSTGLNMAALIFSLLGGAGAGQQPKKT